MPVQQQRPSDALGPIGTLTEQHPAAAPALAPAPAPGAQAGPTVAPLGPVGADPAAAASVLSHWGSDAAPSVAPAAPAPAAPSPAQAPAATPAQAPAPTPAQAPAQTQAPATSAAPPTGTADAAQQEAEPTHLDRHVVTRALGTGSNGDQVKALQRFLGIDETGVDGKYGPGTAKKVKEWQKAHGLPETGRVDDHTIAAMRGDPYIFGYSFSHDPGKFVPKYAMTAYHESNDMRTAADPYATGCITHPDRKTDPGGQTYGTYQFESYTYPGGESAGKDKVAGSTVSRFANWKDNPYGQQLKAVIAKNGIGSAEFDAAWKQLAAEHNREFGQAQEAFLEFDKAAKVKAIFDELGASEEVRKDPRLVDLMIGTTNQLGGLSDTVAKDVKAQQTKSGKPFNADQLARAVIDDKIEHVDSFFSSSKKDTRDGVRARYNDERTVFPEKKNDQTSA